MVSVNKTEPLLDSKVKIKGSVRPAAPGAQVTLQVKYENRKAWKTIDDARLTATGRFKFKDKVGSVRERRYRVVKPASDGHAAGRASTKLVTVFGWRDLDSLSPAQAVGFGEAGEVKINAVSYPHSLQSYNYPPPQATHIDYNLNRACKAFMGTFGLSDLSAAAGTTAMSLVADGVPRYTGSFALTQSQPVSADVTGVFRITVNATNADGGLGAVGTPQVLCSF
jgi:hypothetical protein